MKWVDDQPVQNRAQENRWNVMVETGGLVGCVGSYRWRWVARLSWWTMKSWYPNQEATFQWGTSK